MAKKELPKYDIGDFVSVTAQMLRRINNNNVSFILDKFPEPRQGRVIGVAIRYSGKRKNTYAHYVWGEVYKSGEGYLEVSEKHCFYKVIFGYTNNFVLVDEKDMSLVEAGKIKDLPYKWTNPYKWTEGDREDMSKYSKAFPRDSKGRFC